MAGSPIPDPAAAERSAGFIADEVESTRYRISLCPCSIGIWVRSAPWTTLTIPTAFRRRLILYENFSISCPE